MGNFSLLITFDIANKKSVNFYGMSSLNTGKMNSKCSRDYLWEPQDTPVGDSLLVRKNCPSQSAFQVLASLHWKTIMPVLQHMANLSYLKLIEFNTSLINNYHKMHTAFVQNQHVFNCLQWPNLCNALVWKLKRSPKEQEKNHKVVAMRTFNFENIFFCCP